MMRASELLKQVSKGVEAFLDSEEWKRYLDTASRFHRYSFYNRLTIHMYRPTATFVAGYKKWQKLGRHVKKGEHGIPILVPIRLKHVEVNDDGEEEVTYKLRFKVAYVFDVSQTEGEPLPSPIKLLDGDDAGLLDRVVSIVDRPVRFVEGLAANAEVDNDEVRVRADLPPRQMVKTLLHEVAHVRLGHLGERAALERERRELEAESVAYIVCQSLGIDSSDYTFGYLASWARSLKDVGKVLSESGKLLTKVADDIVEALGGGLSIPMTKGVVEGVGAQ